MILEQSRHVGKLIIIPLLTYSSQHFGWSLTAAFCAGSLCACAVLTVFIKSPGEADANAKGLSHIWQGQDSLVLSPLGVISRSMTSYIEEPKRKRELVTPFFFAVCAVNAVSMGYINSIPSLFQVGGHRL